MSTIQPFDVTHILEDMEVVVQNPDGIEQYEFEDVGTALAGGLIAALAIDPDTGDYLVCYGPPRLRLGVKKSGLPDNAIFFISQRKFEEMKRKAPQVRQQREAARQKVRDLLDSVTIREEAS